MTDPAEGSAGNLRDLDGEENTCPPDTNFPPVEGSFFATEDTEVTEALGSLASYTGRSAN